MQRAQAAPQAEQAPRAGRSGGGAESRAHARCRWCGAVHTAASAPHTPQAVGAMRLRRNPETRAADYRPREFLRSRRVSSPRPQGARTWAPHRRLVGDLSLDRERSPGPGALSSVPGPRMLVQESFSKNYLKVLPAPVWAWGEQTSWGEDKRKAAAPVTWGEAHPVSEGALSCRHLPCGPPASRSPAGLSLPSTPVGAQVPRGSAASLIRPERRGPRCVREYKTLEGFPRPVAVSLHDPSLSV